MQAQSKGKRKDQGNRSAVTAGKNLSGFVEYFSELVRANGLMNADVHVSKAVVVLPGFFRPTKEWDIVVVHQGALVAAVELKSMVGSEGNNFNNRVEEALGNAVDFWTAHEKGAFKFASPPFLGWFMVVGDSEKANSDVGVREPHFEVFSEFHKTSYLDRYRLFCEKAMREKHYTQAAVIASTEKPKGTYRDLSKETGFKAFVSELAGSVAAYAAKVA